MYLYDSSSDPSTLFLIDRFPRMSLFSPTPKNRRRRIRRKKGDEQWFLGIEMTGSAKSRTRQRPEDKLSERVHVLNVQIGALEQFISKKNASAARLEQMKRDGVLPPSNFSRVQNQKTKSAPRFSKATRRRQIQERNRNGLRFLFLFGSACALAWWLIFCEM